MMQIFLKSLLILIAPLLLVACQKDENTNLNPSENPDWELVETFEGHQKGYTDRFELNDSKALIEYEAKSSEDWTHSSLEVFVGKGDEAAWENPEVEIFNRKDAKGISFFERSEGSYFLYIKPLEVHYKLNVYQKKGVSKPESGDSQTSEESHGGH